jgi:hypothetical protein
LKKDYHGMASFSARFRLHPREAETMNVPKIMAVAALFSGSVQAEQRVTIYVKDGTIVPGQTLARAEGLAGEMFAKAGVRVNWRVGHPNGEAIAVGMSDVPSSYHPGALAFASPYQSVHITVFYDRIHKRFAPDLAPVLLAHVLVHEITHILQGIDRHSETGVMKAQWTPADFSQMLAKPLPFTDWDVELIHEGLASRDVRISARNGIPEIPSPEQLQ